MAGVILIEGCRPYAPARVRPMPVKSAKADRYGAGRAPLYFKTAFRQPNPRFIVNGRREPAPCVLTGAAVGGE